MDHVERLDRAVGWLESGKGMCTGARESKL